MKTAMKRLLSFVLVAMMLVSVVPFQASAEGEALTLTKAHVHMYCDGKYEKALATNMAIDATIATEADLLAEAKGMAEKEGYTVERTALESAGDAYNVYVHGAKIPEPTTTPEPTTAPDVTFYVSAGVEGASVSNVGQFKMASDTAEATLIEEAKKVFNASGVEAESISSVTIDATPDSEGNRNIYVRYVAKTEPTTPDPTEPTPTTPDPTEPTPTTPDPTEPTPTTPDPTTPDPTEPADPTVPTGEFAVTFKYCDKEDCTDCDETGDCYSVTLFTKNQKLEMVPGVPDRYGYSFSYWKNNSNGTKGLQDTYTSDITYTAIYKKDADSNLHKLKVYGVIANHGKENVLSAPLAIAYVKDEADLLYALQSKATAIQNELNLRGYSEENKYTWDGVTFYDDDDMNSDDKVKTGVEVTGNGNYYVKVNYTGNNKVQLYIHTSKSLTIKDTVTLTTYAPKETISKSQISTAVKNDGWRFDSIKTYTQESWEKIVDGGSADETKSFDVVEGETEIHVYLNGAYSSGSGNNSDNPKTGDTILMAVTAMGLSATALAAVYFFMKKKAV